MILGRVTTAAVALLALSSCANDPLVFASSDVIGIRIAVSPSETQPLKLNVGYEGYRGAIVPTTREKEKEPHLATSDICISKDAAARECTGAQDTDASGEANQSGAGGGGSIFLPESVTMPATIGDTPNRGGREERSDAFSTVATFDAGIFAGREGANLGAHVKLGNMFATGIAAQNVSTGIEYSMAYSAANPTECVAKLETALGKDKLTPELVSSTCRPALTKYSTQNLRMVSVVECIGALKQAFGDDLQQSTVETVCGQPSEKAKDEG